MKLYAKENIEELEVSGEKEWDYAFHFLKPMIINGIDAYIENIDANLMLLNIDDLLLPIVITSDNFDSSYVASTYAQYVSYAKEELKELKKPKLEKALHGVLNALGYLLKKTQINHAVYVNNWFLSTNLYLNLSVEQLKRVHAFLKKEFPDNAIIYRSINEVSTCDVGKTLSDIGYQKLASRQVYFAKKIIDMKKNQKKNVRQDYKKIESECYELTDASGLSGLDLERTLELYKLLYIEQYSAYNPQFTTNFIKLGLENNLFEFKLLKKSGCIDGVLGYFEREGVMTTPILGYDTELPLKTGLYRMLTSVLNSESEKHDLLLHRSSGAAEFKKNRGSFPAIEYNFVFYKHLPLKQKIGWGVLRSVMNNVALPLLKKFGL